MCEPGLHKHKHRIAIVQVQFTFQKSKMMDNEVEKLDYFYC